jgi:menaquinone-dependent protoporphyrinogen oxidase
MNVLVTAASRHGATREIAGSIAAGLQTRGISTDERPIDGVASLAGYDACVIGSAVYVGHWLDAARELVETHAAALAGRPVFLFSSGPLGAPDALKPEGDPVDVANLVELTGAVDHRVFAGRLDRKLLSFGEKALVVAVRAPEGDFRDWDAVDAFAGEIAAHLGAEVPSWTS